MIYNWSLFSTIFIIMKQRDIYTLVHKLISHPTQWEEKLIIKEMALLINFKSQKWNDTQTIANTAVLQN